MILHGVFLSIANTGTLITGKSGSGKSTLALSLLRLGHRLIADDAPYFFEKNNKIFGKSPSQLQDYLYVSDLGIINVKKLFGKKSLVTTKQLEIIINLKDTPQKSPHKNFAMKAKKRRIFNHHIYQYSLNKNSPHLTFLTESVVNIFNLQKKGYFSHTEFLKFNKVYYER